jgi:DNA-binding XRE family transcriptional regulator
MGGPGSGARRDPARGRRVVELRRQGLTLAQIGRRLYMSRQLVHYYAAAAGLNGPRRGTVHCCDCQAVIATGHHTIEYNRRPLCLACLEKRPDAPFGRRLKACRLAAGLTVDRLAGLAGVPAHAIRVMERGGCWPRWERLVRLIRALGPELVTLGLVDGPAGTKRGRAAP